MKPPRGNHGGVACGNSRRSRRMGTLNKDFTHQLGNEVSIGQLRTLFATLYPANLHRDIGGGATLEKVVMGGSQEWEVEL